MFYADGDGGDGVLACWRLFSLVPSRLFPLPANIDSRQLTVGIGLQEKMSR